MRVARVIARMNVGGPARQVTALHDRDTGLGSLGFEQLLLVGKVGSDEADELAFRAPDVVRSPVPGLGRTPHALDDLRALRSLRQELARFRPDIVHTHTAKAGALGRLAAWSLRPAPKTVHTFHGHLLTGYFSPPARAGVVFAERVLARRTTRLVAVGERVRDDLVAAAIGRRDQYVVLPPGVDLPPAPSQAEARRVLGLAGDPGLVIGFAGRLTTIKRPDRLLAIVDELRDRGIRTTALVAGEGALDAEMRARTEQLELGDSVRFLGLRRDIEVVWAACDVAVITSDNEGMPMALIEAALVGRPAVTTNVGSAGEVVLTGRTGFVVESDVATFAHAVARFTDPGLRARMGAAAQAHATANFSASRLVSDTGALYEQLVTRAEARGSG